MAVVSVNEQWAQARAVTSKDGRSYVRIYHVTCDAVSDGPRTARDADDGSTAIPDVWDPYPGDSGSKVARKTAVYLSRKDRLHFLVTVEYEFARSEYPDRDPLDLPPEIHWGHTQYGEVLYEDINNAPIANTAGQLFDPPLEGEKSRLVCQIRRNEASYSPATADQYQDSVNDGQVTIGGLTVAAGLARMRTFQGDKRYWGATEYWEVVYEIELRREGHPRRVLSHGLYQLNNVGDPAVDPDYYDPTKATGVLPIPDNAGNDIKEPRNLDEYGYEITAASKAAGGYAYNAYFQSFDVKPAEDWSLLSLPIS